MPQQPQVWKIRVTSPDCMNAPTLQFMQGMMDRMGVSFHKYGHLADNVPAKRTGLDNMQQRIDKYRETGNTEWLMDAANYCLIEFLRPSVPDAHFRSTDSDESPGAVNRDGTVSHGGGRGA